jgi:hypothetical protein
LDTTPPGCVAKVLRHLTRGPHEVGATALLLIPQWREAPWWPMTSGLELLHEIEKGSRIFTRPGKKETSSSGLGGHMVCTGIECPRRRKERKRRRE